MTKDTKDFLENLARKGKLPPFEALGSRPCRICGAPNDHGHFRYDEVLKRNVIVEEPPE